MGKFIEEFYYGNLDPQARMNTPWRMVRIDRWSWCIVAV